MSMPHVHTWPPFFSPTKADLFLNKEKFYWRLFTKLMILESTEIKQWETYLDDFNYTMNRILFSSVIRFCLIIIKTSQIDNNQVPYSEISLANHNFSSFLSQEFS